MDYTAEEQAAIGRITGAIPLNVSRSVIDSLGPLIVAEMRRAIAAEREACAALVDTMWIDASEACGLRTYGIGSGVSKAADELAARIRARR